MRWAFVVLIAISLLVPSAVASATNREPPPPTQSAWTIEVVGLHGGSAEPDLALDSKGTPHVLYCPPGEVRFAGRAPSGWASDPVVLSPGGGVCGELAMGPGDIPHITTPWATAYGAETYGTRVNGTWNLAPYPGGLLDAVNSRGEPQLVTYANLAGGLAAFRHRTFMGGVWVDEDVDLFPGFVWGAAWASLVLDAADNPRVLYYDSVRGDVRYAFRNETGWHVEVVEHGVSFPAVGRNGGLVLDSAGNAHATYLAMTGPSTDELRYAVRSPSGWGAGEIVDTQASYPAISIGADDRPQLSYVRLDFYDPSRFHSQTRLLHAVRAGSSWTWDTVLSTDFDGLTATGTAAQFVSMAVDGCNHAHLAYYYTQRAGSVISGSGVYYAANGFCSPSARNVALRVEPRTLNLKSRGTWVTAQVTVDGASAADVDLASLELNGVPAAWARRLNDTALLAKFDRQRFAATLAPGQVTITLAGMWTDGGGFTATDAIRVIRPGR